ncbi:MAG: PAS domain S-box protein [Nitrospirae bacterium]|nr:PAS domain S-box protein [Magnetococcales bacterium]
MADLVRELTQDLEEKVRILTQKLKEKTAEQEKSAQENGVLVRRSNLILQAISEGIYGVDSREQTTFINNAGAAMIGWQARELIGQHQHVVMHHTKVDGSPYPSEDCPICLTSRDGKPRTMDHEVFWRKDGSFFPVEYTATPILENGEIKGAVVVFRDISERLKTAQFNQQLLMLQRVVNAIHRISYDTTLLGEQLEKALEEILTIPWFFNQSKGAVFLVNEADHGLEMVAQKGLDQALLTACAKVPLGHCLCGRSAATNTFLHASGIDERHDITFSGIQGHGHYIVPLVSAQRVMGVLNLYLEHGHERDAQEESALHTIGHAMARLIERRQAEERLLFRNADLEENVRTRTRELQEHVQSLKEYQHQLIHSERMAALGGMVAGIAHEINTPIGIGFTSATYLKNRTQSLREIIDSDEMTYEKMYDYLDVATESSSLIEANLRRASELIKSFKMVAVDQTSQEVRGIDLKQYIDEIILSLRPKFRNTKYGVVVNCADGQHLETYPGAISQILTNLVMNSLIHGFEGLDEGKIVIDACIRENQVVLTYRDNGRGMNGEGVKRLFEPFFTTRRGRGGSGLGMHMVYNLVTQTLQGSISCQSAIGEGTVCVIQFPRMTPKKQWDVESEGVG